MCLEIVMNLRGFMLIDFLKKITLSILNVAFNSINLPRINHFLQYIGKSLVPPYLYVIIFFQGS